MKLLLIILLCAAHAAHAAPAQTNAPLHPIYGSMQFTPAWFAANAHWRAIQGTIYNTRVAPGFFIQEGQVSETLTNGVWIIRDEYQEKKYATAPGRATGPASYGNAIGGLSSPRQVYLGSETKVLTYALTNLPPHFTNGFKIDGVAKRIDTYSHRGESLTLYDCGTVLNAEEIAAFKAKLDARAIR